MARNLPPEPRGSADVWARLRCLKRRNRALVPVLSPRVRASILPVRGSGTEGHDFLRRAISSNVGSRRHQVLLQLSPAPSTGVVGRIAGTIQRPFLPCPAGHGHKIRSIPIRAEAQQIASEALRTFHAMADSGAHITPATRLASGPQTFRSAEFSDEPYPEARPLWVLLDPAGRRRRPARPKTPQPSRFVRRCRIPRSHLRH